MTQDISDLMSRVDHDMYCDPGVIMGTEMLSDEYGDLPRCGHRHDSSMNDYWNCELPQGHTEISFRNHRVTCTTQIGAGHAERYYRKHPDMVGELTADWQELRKRWQALVVLYNWLRDNKLSKRKGGNYACGKCGCLVDDIFVHVDWHTSNYGGDSAALVTV